jgi:hypothetical protein
MAIVPFPRSPDPARTLAELQDRTRPRAMPTCDITVRKDDRERRYVIRSDASGYWIGEVWFGRAQHRRRRVAGVYDANVVKDQFKRELRDLLEDGWTE